MAESTAVRPKSYRTAVAQAARPEELAALLTEERARLKDANQRQPQGTRVCSALTDCCDQIIQRMLSLALPTDPPLREATRTKISILATGGYGRRELCPYSDIDVTFVVSEEEDPALDAAVRQMFLMLMEIFSQRCGLKVGYGYRTLADVGQLDHQTQTALLDARVVAGSHGLRESFLAAMFRSVWPAAFVRLKLAERREVSERHGPLYRVEPEVREGPGGLRDLHLAEWLAAVSFPSTRGEVWPQLQRLGLVTRDDVEQVTDARDFLLTVRTWMHWQTERKAEVLVRERQEPLAGALGFQDDDRASAVERFMERYFQHTENVRRVSSFVTDRCLAERLSLTDELLCSGSELGPAFPWVRLAQPRFLVELGQHYQAHGLVPGYDLRRMIAEQIDGCPDIAQDTEAGGDFVGLLRQPAGHSPGVHDTLSLLADLGALQRLIPEFGEAYRRVPFDQVHRLTIGYHSLQAVRSLEALRTTTDEKLQEFRRVWSEVPAPEVLFLATLLHDIGKLTSRPLHGAAGHSEQGAEMAGEICRRLRLEPQATAAVQKLVRHHLLMSETAQLRDLTLEKTVQDFTQEIGSREILDMLLLLTYADIEATGVMSPVKVRFLEDLYFRAENLLAAPPPTDAAAAPERERRFRTRLSRRLSATNLTPDQVREHTEGMPVSYLLNTRPDEVALHIRMVEALRSDGPVVEFEHDPASNITTIHLCTLERPEPGLLSQIAGVLYAHEVSVHAAQVFTRGTEPRIALDSLWTDYHGRVVPPLKRLELEQDLVSTLKSGDVEAVLKRARKHLLPPIGVPKVRFDNELAESHTVVEIRAEDQPALLYRIARAMAALGWNIYSARISTRGDHARDAFYVTGPGGGKLVEDEARHVDAFLAEFAK